MESKNVPSVTMRARDRSVVITRSFTVQGAADMPAQYSGKPFHPDMIVVKLQDGQLNKVSVSGPRRLSKGFLGMMDRVRKEWWSQADLERDAPEWVRDCLATVLRMEQAGRA